jgi:hypothetical protein
MRGGNDPLTIIVDEEANTIPTGKPDMFKDASDEGKRLLHVWLDAKKADIDRILALFDTNGEPNETPIFPGKLLKATALMIYINGRCCLLFENWSH